MDNYKLSILLVVFNHELYIDQAMRSIIGQNIKGPVELVIADDCSTDRSLEIVKCYEGLDDRFVFKYLDNSLNRGVTRNYQRGFAACSGKYVAVIEGDDYWCSPFKMQTQCDFLDTQWQCEMCSVNYYIFDSEHRRYLPRVAVTGKCRFIHARDLIADNLVGNFSTCMYRKAALATLPVELFDVTSYDWIVNICVARQSLIGFIDEPMSVYRLHSGGVWSQTPNNEKLRMQIDLIPAYDKITNYEFEDDFEMLRCNLVQALEAADKVEMRLMRLGDFVPPLLMAVVRSLIPPVMKKFLKRILAGA